MDNVTKSAIKAPFILQSNGQSLFFTVAVILFLYNNVIERLFQNILV